jgi:tetratricopeptide (TPR) repeat protein
MGTLGDLIPLLYDVEIDQLSDVQIRPDDALGALNVALGERDLRAAQSLLDTEIARLQPIYRVVASEAGSLVRDDPVRGLNMPLYLSDLHCRRARLRLRSGELEGARKDLAAAQMLPAVHPDAAPLLVEVYEAAGRPNYAMSLLSRLHREDQLSRAIGLLRLLVNGQHVGCPHSTVSLGVDLLAQTDPWHLFDGIIEEHARWTGPPPGGDWLSDNQDQLISAYRAQDWTGAKGLVQRLLAWAFDSGRLWWILGDVLERESGHLRTTDPADHFAVIEVPDDPTLLHAAADAFHLSAHFDQSEFIAWTALSGTRLALGEIEAAMIAADHALAINPRSAEAHWLMAQAQQGLGRPEAALGEIFTVVELDPTFEPARQFLSAALGERNHGHD